MRPQPHGGSLRNGGTNKGGPGRPTNELRELCREIGWEGLAYARLIVAGKVKKAGPLVRMKALDLLLKYGVGTRMELQTPNTPIAFGFLVSEEVAAEMKQKESAA
jgi:hypothetical protein